MVGFGFFAIGLVLGASTLATPLPTEAVGVTWPASAVVGFRLPIYKMMMNIITNGFSEMSRSGFARWKLPAITMRSWPRPVTAPLSDFGCDANRTSAHWRKRK
jgi:hypothetical protein